MESIGDFVSPLAGEWIEIKSLKVNIYITSSHPLRVSGLKSDDAHPYVAVSLVSPLAGEWIEITS